MLGKTPRPLNYLAKNRSEGSGLEGFFIGGNHNKIYLNRSVANLEGFLIFLSDHNRLFHNGAKGNIQEGINIIAGQQNHVHRNKVYNNEREGIVIGFWSKGNKIVHNRVKNNGYHGIVAAFGSLDEEEENLIAHNVVKENGTASNEIDTYYDLYDMNGEATPNVWQNNRYGTKNPETLD